MIYQKQPLIAPQFTDMNGSTWNKIFIACYNNLTNDINKPAGIDIKTDSLTDKERAFFLDQRYKNCGAFSKITDESNALKFNDFETEAILATFNWFMEEWPDGESAVLAEDGDFIAEGLTSSKALLSAICLHLHNEGLNSVN